jgi:methylenetetrahydrofolate reductase (NADPH)
VNTASTIAERLRQGGPSFSFEFTPPADRPGAQDKLWDSLRRVEKLSPSFVSVTYGAGGGQRGQTVELTGRILAETTMLPVGHLTAVGHSTAELRSLAAGFLGVGVRHVLALRGDPPGDPDGDWVPHPDGVTYAEDVVRLLRDAGDFCVGVAAVPAKHPRSPDRRSDVEHFVRKCRAGADFAITQMFWDVQDYLRFRDDVAARGCDVPIIPEIMPITSLRQVPRLEKLSGTAVPGPLIERLTRHGDDPVATRAAGIEISREMCEKLLADGAPGLHFITMNAAAAAIEVFSGLGRSGTPSLTAGSHLP